MTLSREQCRALQVLFDAGLQGCTGAMLLADGFSIDLLADLVREGFATAHREPLKAGERQIEVARVRITDRGRKALEGPRQW